MMKPQPVRPIEFDIPRAATSEANSNSRGIAKPDWAATAAAAKWPKSG